MNKRCSSCDAIKPFTEFNKHAGHADGLSSNCTSCRARKSKVYWVRNREALIAKHQKYYRQRRATDPSFVEHAREYGRQKMKRSRIDVFNHYGNACACCGETENSFLSIDHINGGGMEERTRLKKWGHNFYDWLKRQGYPSGYQTLCFNCNMAKGFFGQCPHEADSNRDAIYLVGGAC